MSTTLFQSNVAAFPDKPSSPGMGVLATLGTGDVGATLSHTLTSSPSSLYVRFVMNASGLSGGRVILLGGLSSGGLPVMRLGYDADTRALSYEVQGIAELTCILDDVLPWHCVEIGADRVSGSVGLWINGVQSGEAFGDLSGLYVQTIFLGAIQKQAGVVGALYLDAWSIADAYIGPVVVEPKLSHAGDPSRWLVVYNTADADAVAWAESYRQARGIPFANLAGLSLPNVETINATQYAELLVAVSDYLSVNQLDEQVMGVLLGYRVPGYVEFINDGVLEAVASLMQTDDLSAGTATNPHASPVTYQRLTLDELAGVRMTARFDAPDLQTAAQLLDRAVELTANGPSSDDSIIYFDPFVGDEPSYQQAFGKMLDWATGLRSMHTRLPILLSGDPSGNQEASFAEVSGDGFFWGWSSTLPDPDIFITPAGRRAMCAQVFLEGATATTLRNTAPYNWAVVPIAAGYAGVIVSSRDNPVSAMPDVGAFFDALDKRWTLAEAWHVAQPLLRSGFYLVGDPLMTIALPRMGLDVFGPIDSLENLDPASPDFVLAEGVTGLDLSSNVPALGTMAHYLVRRTDAQGRVESSITTLRIVNQEGEARRPMTMPIWPDLADWPVVGEVGKVRLTIVWPCPIKDAHIHTIELLSQEDNQDFAVEVVPKWHPLDCFVLVELPLPTARTRYLWRLTSPDGEVRISNLSTWHEPAETPTVELLPIGGTS